MLHVLTVHHREPRWVPIQHRYLRRFVGMPYRTWAVIEAIPDELAATFDLAVEFEGGHGQRLNHLSELVLDAGSDDDWILFLDSDAMPLRPMAEIMELVPRFGAIRRDDNVGDLQPHPSFALTRLGFWRELEGDWQWGAEWLNGVGWTCRDTGGYVLRRLDALGVAWTQWTRVNTVDMHPLWFGVYGDERSGPIVYHHGAGSRSRISRRDLYDELMRRYGKAEWARLGEALDALQADEAWNRSNELQAEEVLQRIERDDDFWRAFAADGS